MPITFDARSRLRGRVSALLAAKRESAADVDAAVARDHRRMCAARGDAALIEYTRRFDGVDADAGDAAR